MSHPEGFRGLPRQEHIGGKAEVHAHRRKGSGPPGGGSGRGDGAVQVGVFRRGKRSWVRDNTICVSWD